MPTKATVPLNFRERFEEQEAAQRERLSTLLDETFDAYVNAGFDVADYTSRQFYINLLFQAINDTPKGTYQRQGAYLVGIRFMQRLKRVYEDERDERAGKNGHE